MLGNSISTTVDSDSAGVMVPRPLLPGHKQILQISPAAEVVIHPSEGQSMASLFRPANEKNSSHSRESSSSVQVTLCNPQRSYHHPSIIAHHTICKLYQHYFKHRNVGSPLCLVVSRSLWAGQARRNTTRKVLARAASKS